MSMSVSDDDSSSSSSSVDEAEIMNLLSNPYSSLEDEEEEEEEEEEQAEEEEEMDVPDIEIPVASLKKRPLPFDDKGKEEEGATSEEEEEEESVLNGTVPPTPLFATPIDQYSCYAFVIYYFYYYLCMGEYFDIDNAPACIEKLSKEQKATIDNIATLASVFYSRTLTTASIAKQRLVELCNAKRNASAAQLIECVAKAALFQKSKVSDDDASEARCVISGEKAEFTISVVSAAAATDAQGKKSVEWTVQEPVAPNWTAVLQLLYLLGHLPHLLKSEISRQCGKVDGVPMAKGADAMAYINENLISTPFFDFKEEDRRLVVKKNSTGAYVFGQVKKQCKPVTLLSMEIALRLSILMQGLRAILTDEQLTPP